jgi:hypothetical protein
MTQCGLLGGKGFDASDIGHRILLEYLQAEGTAQGDHKFAVTHASKPSPACNSILTNGALDEGNIGILCIELHSSFQVIINIRARRRYHLDCRDRAPSGLDLRTSSSLSFFSYYVAEGRITLIFRASVGLSGFQPCGVLLSDGGSKRIA